MILKIAVASDFHCHRSTESPRSSYLLSDGPRIPVSQHPLASLHELIDKENIAADILALPGDFTDKACQQGFIVGLFSARELAQRLGAKDVVACLGNHDVISRGGAGTDPLHLGKNLFVDFPMAGAERDRFFSQGFAIQRGKYWTSLLVSSVHEHRTSEQAKRGIVTQSQLEAIDLLLRTQKAEGFRFCLVHHHPIAHEELGLGAHDLMEGGEGLLKLLEQHSFNLLIHGHKHHPRIRYSNSGVGSLVVFASGSLSAIIGDRLARSVRNTFHLIEINTEKSTPSGVIRTWEFSGEDGWVPGSYRSAGIPHLCGFGTERSISDISAEVISRVKPLKWMRWSEAIDAIQGLGSLTPTQLCILNKQLQAANLKLEPFPEEPNLIGGPV